MRRSAAALRQRPATGLLAGLWEFPNVPGALTERQAAEQLLAQDPALTSCPATAERVTELFTQQADALN